MKIAHVTLVRDEPATATILSKQFVESVPFWKITWAPGHVVFHTNASDENAVVAYHSDRVYEIVTQDMEE